MTKLKKEDVEDIIILSSTQEGILFHYLNDSKSKIYFEQVVLNLYADIDFNLLNSAWEFVISENEMLRTVFRWEKLSSPVQIILKGIKTPLNFLDFSQITFDYEKQELLNKVLVSDLDKINLYNTPFHITLCKYQNIHFKMILNYHHILFDGWSLGLVIRGFFDTYSSMLQGKQPAKINKMKYKEFIKYCKSIDRNKYINFWTDYLEGIYTPIELPLIKKKEDDEFTIKSFVRKLPDNLSVKLYDLAKEKNMTISSFFYCAWCILLHKCNSSTDIIFGTTVSGRTEKLKSINDSVGLFINTIPLRVKFDLNLTVIQLTEVINKILQERREFENTPLVEIKDCSSLKSGQSLFKSIIVVENYPINNILKSERFANFKVDLDSIHESTNYDLSIIILAFDKLEICFLYNSAVYDVHDIERLMYYYINLVCSIIKNPEVMLYDITMLSEREKEDIIKKSMNRQNEGGYDFD